MRYEWRDTNHGSQLWDLDRNCWVLWYGVGAILVSDNVKKDILDGLNRKHDSRKNLEALCGQINTLRWVLEEVKEHVTEALERTAPP